MSDTTHRYFQSAKVAPAVARGVQKVMEVTIETPIEVLMGNMGIFRDPERTIIAKTTALVQRCVNLGLTLPSESTIKESVAVLSCAHLPDATPQQLYGMVTELKAVGPRANSLARVASHGLQP